MELILGAMVIALWVRTVPGAISDMVTAMRASKAGAWDVIDKERDRKAARSKARRDAIAAVRTKRNKQAGGTGKYRPGLLAYLGDVYHGLWEDELEKRKAKRAARPPIGPDGKRPPVGGLDHAVEAKVERQRTKTGYLGRVARKLIDPVGEGGQPADTTSPPAADPQPNLAGTEPRTACPTCGETLTRMAGGWYHPDASTCADQWMDGRPVDDGTPTSVIHESDATTYPTKPTVYEKDHLDRLADQLAQTRRDRGGLGLTSCERCGTEVHIGFLTPRGVGGTTKQVCAACAEDIDLIRGGRPDLSRCDRCRTYARQAGSTRCESCDGALTSLRQVADAAWFQVDPNGLYRERDNQAVCELVKAQNTHGWKPDEIHAAVLDARRNAHPNQTTDTNSNGGTDMNTATGDVVDVETCKNECAALADDLTRVDTALDVIDEAIRQAKDAVERIEAWLRSKNADACVPGMSTALDALSADRIKELIDAVTAAKQGVSDTIDNLAPLEEAAELVGGTDGSALNGR